MSDTHCNTLNYDLLLRNQLILDLKFNGLLIKIQMNFILKKIYFEKIMIIYF